jgi:hypothetical protein
MEAPCREHQKRQGMTQAVTQMSSARTYVLPKLLRDLVDLVGFEPTTPSMPFP